MRTLKATILCSLKKLYQSTNLTRAQCARTPMTTCLAVTKLAMTYKLTNPPAVVKEYELHGQQVKVIDDGSLPYGTKQRGYQYAINLFNNGIKTVYTTALPLGYGMLALSWMCKSVGIQVVFVLSYTVVTTMKKTVIHQSAELGAKFVFVIGEGSELRYTTPRKDVPKSTSTKVFRYKSRRSSKYEGDYANVDDTLSVCDLLAQRSYTSLYLKLGMSSPEFIHELYLSLLECLFNVPQPQHLWMACGSGATVEALAKVWPDTTFHCVQVGRRLPNFEFKHVVHKSELKMTREVSDVEVPFSTMLHYDAKAWREMSKYAEDNDMTGHVMWNVGSAVEE